MIWVILSKKTRLAGRTTSQSPAGRSLIAASNLVLVSLCWLGWPMTNAAGANDPYEGSLDRSAARGFETIRHAVPDGRPDEIAVIPKHLSSGAYRGANGADDRATEQLLAHYDFYKGGNTPDNAAVAVCPKQKSTSAAVELFEIPAGGAKPATETAAYCSQVEKTGKDLAKFKQTDNHFTSTSTASILGYYHVSRALGDICLVQPAELRTMDIEQHKKVVRLAAEMGIHGLVGKSWNLFNGYYQNPRGSSVATTLFTNDFTQIYGALLVNTRGEEHYDEWLRAGPNLGSVRGFRDMADPRPVHAILASTEFNQANVQRLVAMRDMSEMIVLDYLMAQSDRLSGGNISDYKYIYEMNGGHITTRPAKNDTTEPQGVVIRRLILVDNDAGLLNQNTFQAKGYLNQICHLHPETYRRLVAFAQEWKESPVLSGFFHQECTFSEAQLARFARNLATAAAILQERVTTGALHLDLDLGSFFLAGPATSKAKN